MIKFTKVDQASDYLSIKSFMCKDSMYKVQSASACMCTQNSTDLSDGQGSLTLFPIPRLEAIAATQLTRRRFLTDI